MNLRKVEKALVKLLNNKGGLNFEYTVENNKLNAKCNVSFDDLGVVGFCSFSFFTSGMAIYSVYYDNIDANAEVCELLNAFNKDSLYFKAYADEFLVIEHTISILQDGDVTDYTDAIIGELIDEDFLKNIKPLIDLTYQGE